MKAKKLLTLSLATLMSFSMIACGSGEKAFDYGTVEADKISFSRTAVTEIEVGETIDLADYVTVSPEDVKWNLEIVEGYEGIVSVDGTKITGKKPGQFKVSVVAGSTKTIKNYQGSVVSADLKAARDLFKAIDEGDYTAVLLTADYNKEASERLLTLCYHNKNYFSFINEFGEFEGILKSGLGHSLAYTYSGENLDIDFKTYLPFGGTLNVETAYQTDISLYTFTTPLKVTDDKFTEWEGEDGIELSSTVFEDLFAVTLGVDYEALRSELGAIKTATIEYSKKDNNASIFFQTKDKDACELLITNIGSTKIKELDDYVAAKTEPARVKFEAFDTRMGEINEAKNYTIEGKVRVGNKSQNGTWVDTTSEAALNAMAEDWGGIAPVSYTAKVDGENYVAVDNDTNDTVAYVKHEGSLYYVSGSYADGKTTYAAPEAFTALDSIWEPDIAISQEGYTAPAPFTTVDLAGEYLEAIDWDDLKTTGTVTSATASPYGDQGHFCGITMALVPGIGASIGWMFSTLYSTVYPTAKWFDFMDYTEASVDSATGNVTLATGLSGMVAVGSTVFGVRFEVTIKDVGETIPLDAVVEEMFTPSSSAE